jgi:glutathione S-transferase
MEEERAMTRILYDLAGADPARRFSPFCWRSKMALAHKGIAVETVPWRFVEKEKIAFSGKDKVPVLVDGEHVVADSWAIADYLESSYPDLPPLFAGPGERGLAKFVAAWTDSILHPAVFCIVALDIVDHLDPGDRAYFRESREARIKATLETWSADREGHIAALRQALMPLRLTLKGQDYLGGSAPGYADYIVFGAFQWARCISPAVLLAPDDPVFAWRRRLLDAFDGLGGRALGYDG